MLVPLAGLVAGAIHVLSGPDHLVAVAPLAADRGGASWRAGALWGLGHTGGVWVVGLIALWLRELIDIGFLSAWSERLVGVVLIAVGLWGFHRLLRQRVHAHAHRHDDAEHTHVHLHRPAASEPTTHEHPTAHRHEHAAAGIGILHGVAGSSHFFGVLPALGLPDRVASLTYLAAFGAGSILAMTAVTWLVGRLTVRLSHLGPGLHRGLLGVCSALAVGVGGWWLTR